jgi:hypothetical protein
MLLVELIVTQSYICYQNAEKLVSSIFGILFLLDEFTTKKLIKTSGINGCITSLSCPPFLHGFF